MRAERSARPTLGMRPGRWLGSGLAFRKERITRCLALGEPGFETVFPSGYDKPIERCVRCGTLRRQHQVS
jgi:hypothetical protein